MKENKKWHEEEEHWKVVTVGGMKLRKREKPEKKYPDFAHYNIPPNDTESQTSDSSRALYAGTASSELTKGRFFILN